MPLRAVAAALASPAGRYAVDEAAAEALLSSPLRCQRCGAEAANMPRLREHVAACAAPLRDSHDLGEEE